MKTRGLNVRHAFEPAPPEQAFHFQDGSSAASLEQLHERLAHVPADVLDYHRDHLSAWVRDIVGDEPLALRVAAYAEARPAPETLRDILRDLVGRRLVEWREASPPS